MARRPIPPHRILWNEDVVFRHENGWDVVCGTGEARIVEDGGVVTGWEPGMPIRVSNSVRLAADAGSRLAADQHPEMKLCLVVTACTGRDLEVVARSVHPLSLTTLDWCNVELELDGARLARDLSVHLSVVLGGPLSGGDQLAPRLKGARLWGGRWRSRIEGGRARLPIEAIDFNKYFGSGKVSSGLVHVVVADDPFLEIEQGLVVYLNSEAKGFIGDVSKMEPRATAVLWDAVVRRVILAGAEMMFSANEDYPVGSVGYQWQFWSQAALGKKKAEEILSMHRSEGSEFEVRIQSWVGMKDKFGGGEVRL